jgi:hypothetical protein
VDVEAEVPRPVGVELGARQDRVAGTDLDRRDDDRAVLAGRPLVDMRGGGVIELRPEVWVFTGGTA